MNKNDIILDKFIYNFLNKESLLENFLKNYMIITEQTVNGSNPFGGDADVAPIEARITDDELEKFLNTPEGKKWIDTAEAAYDINQKELNVASDTIELRQTKLYTDKADAEKNWSLWADWLKPLISSWVGYLLLVLLVRYLWKSGSLKKLPFVGPIFTVGSAVLEKLGYTGIKQKMIQTQPGTWSLPPQVTRKAYFALEKYLLNETGFKYAFPNGLPGGVRKQLKNVMYELVDNNELGLSKYDVDQLLKELKDSEIKALIESTKSQYLADLLKDVKAAGVPLEKLRQLKTRMKLGKSSAEAFDRVIYDIEKASKHSVSKTAWEKTSSRSSPKKQLKLSVARTMISNKQILSNLKSLDKNNRLITYFNKHDSAGAAGLNNKRIPRERWYDGWYEKYYDDVQNVYVTDIKGELHPIERFKNDIIWLLNNAEKKNLTIQFPTYPKGFPRKSEWIAKMKQANQAKQDAGQGGFKVKFNDYAHQEFPNMNPLRLEKLYYQYYYLWKFMK